jgi:hypothetical protein
MYTFEKSASVEEAMGNVSWAKSRLTGSGCLGTFGDGKESMVRGTHTADEGAGRVTVGWDPSQL